MHNQRESKNISSGSDSGAGAAKSLEKLQRRRRPGWLFCCLMAASLPALLLVGWWVLRYAPTSDLPLLPPLDNKLANGARRELDLPEDTDTDLEVGKLAETLASEPR